MRVLGITGSLRRDSYNHALLREAAERLPAGVEFVEFERLGEIPPYDADLEEGVAPAAVRASCRRPVTAAWVCAIAIHASRCGSPSAALSPRSRVVVACSLMGTSSHMMVDLTIVDMQSISVMIVSSSTV